MNKQPQTIVFSLATALTLLTSFSNLAVAQSTNPSNPDVYQTNERNANTSSSFGNSFNPLDLIHNANFRRSRDAFTFQEDTETNINQAAEDFKRMQQEQIQNGGNTGPGTTPSN